MNSGDQIKPVKAWAVVDEDSDLVLAAFEKHKGNAELIAEQATLTTGDLHRVIPVTIAPGHEAEDA